MLFHGSSKGLWNFLSLGVAWSARKTEASIEMMFYLENWSLSILFWRGAPECEENRYRKGTGGMARGKRWGGVVPVDRAWHSGYLQPVSG
jgi:hypothetical protein